MNSTPEPASRGVTLPASMGERTFANFLGAFVIALMFWPLFQGWLVQKYGMNPWKGFAIAMYCTRHAVTLEVLAATPKGLISIPSEQLQTPAVYGLYRGFADRRQTLGLLAGPPPEELALAIMKQYPGLRDVLFRIRNYRLDPDSGRMALDIKSVYHYRLQGGHAVLFDQDVESELLGKSDEMIDG